MDNLDMKNILIVVLIIISNISHAGDMNLYDCVGEETGKTEGFESKRQLLIECYELLNKCTAKFFLNEFNVNLQKSGKYTDTVEGPDYFKFDPISGAVQGVTQEPYHYFMGVCTKRK